MREFGDTCPSLFLTSKDERVVRRAIHCDDSAVPRRCRRFEDGDDTLGIGLAAQSLAFLLATMIGIVIMHVRDPNAAVCARHHDSCIRLRNMVIG